MSRSKQTKAQSPVAKWIADFLAAECCGIAPNSGYDAVTVLDRETYETVYENAYYNECPQCGNMDTWLHKDVVIEVAKEANRW